jgi:DNA-binding response OmpR family regulator
MKRKILLVDDDDALRESLAEQLELYEEFKVVQASRAQQAIDLVKTDNYDGMVLDVGLPDMDGRDCCRLLRRGGFKAPIIMLTGAATDADTILGLDAGASDYIAKPFRLNVLLARLRAQMRQHHATDEAIVTIGPFTFQPSTKTLTGSGDKKLRLTEKEAGIIKNLYKAQGRVVPREVLLNDVWGYNAGVTTHTLETHVYRLRQKLEKELSAADLIVTEGGGYRLVV